jgi:hypothetical protein
MCGVVGFDDDVVLLPRSLGISQERLPLVTWSQARQ